MNELKFGMMGAGFWAPYQLAGWQEISGVTCVAICDPDIEKASRVAALRGILRAYSSPHEMLSKENIDFIDIATPVETHADLVNLAISRNIPVICQKPMAVSLKEAETLTNLCKSSETPFFVHENWRWQGQLRAVKSVLEEGVIGDPFRARIDMISGFPVFANQPFFRELKQFILMDLGSHILDLARFYFGEASSVYCQTSGVHRDMKGEDVATVMLKMQNVTVLCELAYAENPLERECFPETLLFIEGDRGSIEISPDCWLKVTTSSGTVSRQILPPIYAWADPAYAVAQTSVVACSRNILKGIHGGNSEMTGEDNLETVRLVFAAYESANSGEVVHLPLKSDPHNLLT